VIRSMTGFGEAAAEFDGVHYFVEVRSLNAKYFKAVIRLPEDLQGLEAELEAALRRRLRRGAVTLVGKCTDTSAEAAHEINQKALDRYIQQARSAPSASTSGASFEVGAFLALPGVIQPPRDDEERLGRARRAFLDLLETACDQATQMRIREGDALADELRDHLSSIESRLALVEERAPKVVEEYQERLLARIQTLLQDAQTQVDPSDLLREVAVYAEKSDIAEETARLRGHIDQFAELLRADGDQPIGRTLDFLSQELLREANTIASKSNDVQISRAVVEIKGAIDRIKEQAQNVE